MRREYLALVHGDMISGCQVDEPIGRHPHNRRIMSVRRDGKSAVTRIRVLKRYGPVTLVRCKLESGRTHQIRVHAGYIGYPIVGDPVYGGARRIPAGVSEGLRDRVKRFGRQALHAGFLALTHPASGKQMVFDVDPPEDFVDLRDALDKEFDDGRD